MYLNSIKNQEEEIKARSIDFSSRNILAIGYRHQSMVLAAEDVAEGSRRGWWMLDRAGCCGAMREESGS